MTKRELIQSIEAQPIPDDGAIMVSIFNDTNDPHEEPVIATIDYAAGHFIIAHID
jgi:hypothetical protein